MSVVEAVKPLRRRALERQGMTEEIELQLLIQEQEADDVFFISRPQREESLDGPVRAGGRLGGAIGAVSEYIGVTDEGEIVSFLPRSNDSLFLVRINHATFDAYNNHSCRCRLCKSFMAEYRRQKRAA